MGRVKGKAVVAGLGQAAKGVVAVVSGLLCTAAEQLTFGVVFFCQLSELAKWVVTVAAL